MMESIIGLFGILISSFIAYHVYFLSKKIELRDSLTHKDNLRRLIEPILQEMNSNRRNHKVEILNVKKYNSHYPENNEKKKDGYTYLGAELKSLKFDGVDFIQGMGKELFRRTDGNYTLKEGNGSERVSTVWEVGTIPYSWIEYVDPEGDELSFRVQFFTKFKGKGKEPFRYYEYYIVNPSYQPENDPPIMKYSRIDIID